VDYKDEDEQVAAVKQWWDENGKYVVGAIVLAIVGNFGWQAYQDNQVATATANSAGFQQVLDADAAGDMDALMAAAGAVQSDNPDSEYARLATLFAAKALVAQDDLAGAAAQLQTVVASTQVTDVTGAEARLRLAQVLAAQGDAQAGLDILNGNFDAVFQARVLEARGDMLVQLGQRAKAKAAYLEAQAAQGGNQLPLLNYKLNELADV